MASPNHLSTIKAKLVFIAVLFVSDSQALPLSPFYQTQLCHICSAITDNSLQIPLNYHPKRNYHPVKE